MILNSKSATKFKDFKAKFKSAKEHKLRIIELKLKLYFFVRTVLKKN